MCGVFGFDVTGLAPEALAALVAAQAGALAPRGPDASGHRVVAGGPQQLLLAAHRLAIIGAGSRAGDQPLVLGAATLVCNGQIYNHRELRPPEGAEALRTDIDAILHLLAPAGTDAAFAQAVAQLDGDFAFVYVRERGPGQRPLVVAARDPVGVRPLFYALGAAAAGPDGARPRPMLGFASEAKALHGAPGVEEVHVFPPGALCVDGRVSQYDWRQQTASLLGATRPEAIDRVARLLESAVRKRVQHSEREVALLCSGGVDSTAIVSLVAKLQRAGHVERMPHLFTVVFRALNRAAADDAFHAQIVAAQLGAQLTVVEFREQDVAAVYDEVVRVCETYDPNTLRAAVPMYLLARHIATHTDCRVVLSGEGADELFMGYLYFKDARSGQEAGAESERLTRNLHMFDLLRADRCFAAHGLDLRVPFLDRDLVAYTLGLDPALRMFQGGAEKALLRDAVRRALAGESQQQSCARQIDRPKERLSDGCGFDYVPTLLRLLARRELLAQRAEQGEGGGEGEQPPLPGDLAGRTALEAAAARRAFRACYGDRAWHWVAERKLWAGRPAQDAATVGAPSASSLLGV